MRTILGITLIVSFILHPCVGHAAWQPNGTGVAIEDGFQTLPTIISDGAGGTIITWADYRNGYSDIYAQRLNGLGVAQWAPNGVVICSAQGDQVGPQIIADGSGGAIVAWDDLRNGNRDIFAQRVNGSGVVQWWANGVAVIDTGPYDRGMYGTIPSLVSDGAGGAIVAWTEHEGFSELDNIYAQRVDGSGVRQWAAEGTFICTAYDNQEDPTIVSDGTGGAILTWTDARDSINGFGFDLYAQRVNASGAPQWEPNGVAVCRAANDQAHQEIVPDGAGGVIVAWDDRRNGADTDIYAQALDALGAAQWTLNGEAVCTAPGDQIAPKLVSSGAGGAIVAWADQRSDPGDIYAQRLNASGVGQWTLNGVVVCTASGAQSFYPQYSGIATDGGGGAYVTWEDGRNGAADIYVQQVTFNGLVKWTPSGAALCTAVGVQDRPTITYVAQGGTGAVVTWEDHRGRADYDVYALPVPNTMIRRVRLVPYPNGIVLPPDPDLYPVHLLFNNVITPGFTSLDITSAGPPLPPSFVLGDGRYYNLSTTAETTDNIEVCIKFDPAALSQPAAALRMFEYNVAGPAGPTWLDVTTGNAAGDSICGTTTTLSTFVIGFPSVTGVGDTPAAASFALHPNLPNPFNPVTTIRYDVPASGADVSISIYDVTGRLIRSLVKEHRAAGEWSVQWHGENDRGQGVASGVYFYRMRAGEFVETKKMMLLK